MKKKEGIREKKGGRDDGKREWGDKKRKKEKKA